MENTAKAQHCEVLHVPQALGDAEGGNVLPAFCPCLHRLSLPVCVFPLVFGILQPEGRWNKSTLCTSAVGRGGLGYLYPSKHTLG